MLILVRGRHLCRPSSWISVAPSRFLSNSLMLKRLLGGFNIRAARFAPRDLEYSPMITFIRKKPVAKITRPARRRLRHLSGRYASRTTPSIRSLIAVLRVGGFRIALTSSVAIQPVRGVRAVRAIAHPLLTAQAAAARRVFRRGASFLHVCGGSAGLARRRAGLAAHPGSIAGSAACHAGAVAGRRLRESRGG